MLLGRLIANPFNCNRHESSCCDFMPTSAECICCKEIARIVAKIGEANDSAVTALLDTQALRKCVSMYGFCKLDTFSTGRNMEVHLHHHHYMSMLITTATYIICFILPFSCRKYRYIAYQQLTRWCKGGWVEISD